MARVLLHVCCAPDATVPWPSLLEEGFEVDACFYGSNIHPKEEFNRRLESLARLAGLLGRTLFVGRYDPNSWFSTIRGNEAESEGGSRCRLCFERQLNWAASEASAGGYEILGSTLSISPHKDPNVINEMGQRAASSFNLAWLDRIWRKGNGFKRSVLESQRLGLFRQNYCGCIFSHRKEL